MNGTVRKARLEDLSILADNLRPADLAEIQASSGSSPLLTLQVGLITGETNVVCLPCGLPVAIFGAIPLPTDETVGVIWMVATTRFKELHGQFLRESRYHVAALSKPYRLVFNYTDARNKVHHRWIKWAGFTIIKRHEKFGHEGLPFLEFVRITENSHV